jgi:hypothetical protein
MTEAIDSTAVEPVPSGLLTAMLAVQAEAPKLPKDGTNPHFKSKFTKLETIVEKVGPILNKHGLVWFAMPSRSKDDGKPVLRYRLAHAPSGEALEDEMDLMLARGGAQEQGSGITYARRYALVSVLNLVADEDDDGHAASAPPVTGGAQMGGTLGLGQAEGRYPPRVHAAGAEVGGHQGAVRGRRACRSRRGMPRALVDGLLKHQASALLDLLKRGRVAARASRTSRRTRTTSSLSRRLRATCRGRARSPRPRSLPDAALRLPGRP